PTPLPTHLTATLPFLSHRYARHLPLPSFPTRRSSDLSHTTRQKWCGYRARFRPAFPVHRAAAVALSACATSRPLHSLSSRTFRRDRKSTRLNSSHVKISYAVFCLKKKKNNNTPHSPTN